MKVKRHKRSAHSSNRGVCAYPTKGNYTDNWAKVTCPHCLTCKPVNKESNRG